MLLQLYKYFKRAKNETPAQPSVWQFEVGWRPLNVWISTYGCILTIPGQVQVQRVEGNQPHQ